MRAVWGHPGPRPLSPPYVILWNTGGRGVTDWEWIFVILALFGDLATYSARAYRRRAAY